MAATRLIGFLLLWTGVLAAPAPPADSQLASGILPGGNEHPVSLDTAAVVKNDTTTNNLSRDKKSASGTCVTVTQPYKAPFTFCNNGGSSAGLGGLADVAGAYGTGVSGVSSYGSVSHLGGGGIGGFGAGLHNVHGGLGHLSGGSGLGLGGGYGGSHLSGGIGHLSGGSGLGLGGGYGGSHLSLKPATVHGLTPSLHVSNGGYGTGAGGAQGTGLAFGGGSFVHGGGLFPGSGFGLSPNQAYGQLPYGGVGLHYRAQDSSDGLEEGAMAKEAGSTNQLSFEDEQELAAAAINQENQAQAQAQAEMAAQSQARQMEMMNSQVFNDMQSMPGEARSAYSVNSVLPSPSAGYSHLTGGGLALGSGGLPLGAGGLQYGSGGVAVGGGGVALGGPSIGLFPNIAGGGGCGALPLLFSCSPQLVRGSFLQAAQGHGCSSGYGLGGLGYQVSPLALGGLAGHGGGLAVHGGGLAVHGGNIYRQTDDSAVSPQPTNKNIDSAEHKKTEKEMNTGGVVQQTPQKVKTAPKSNWEQSP